MVANGRNGFDPYPFILLNLLLSCLAALQGAILLIAAKRSDAIASALAQHDYQTDLEANERIRALHALVEDVHRVTCGHLGRDRPGSPPPPPLGT